MGNNVLVLTPGDICSLFVIWPVKRHDNEAKVWLFVVKLIEEAHEVAVV